MFRNANCVFRFDYFALRIAPSSRFGNRAMLE